MSDALVQNYKRQPVAFERGEGAWLWDSQGRRYLDALSGIAVCGLGHAHPAVAKALCEQARTLVHTSNLYEIPLQTRLAERLTQAAGMQQAFFCNSGAEANEAALKLARLHGHRKGIKRPTVVVMEGSFHGRTLATLTATGNTAIQKGFAPLVEGFVRVPHGDLEAVQALSDHPDVVAVLVEPITGEGGIRIPPADYLKGLRELCNQTGWLLMLDEIQAGIGRTGQLFAYQHEDITPDVLSLAKGLGNGVPIGATLVAGLATGLFTAGTHGTTFGGNPLVCAAALAVLDTLEQQDLPEQARRMGEYLMAGFATRLGGHPAVRQIRGKGLMIGIELDRPCAELVGQALAAGLLINVTAERVIRLLPPLIIDQAQADEIIDTVATLVERFAAQAA
ncbi:MULTISPECIES: acetylornithine transaminase [unclassified Ectothiorhodospira]|uniref:acetylornithine transaminase n=1 Tax=unclassified Ectothiorhodospira TaxID=2684909 RepID=UPI001EE9ACD5|nr:MULTISPECIES: acetylornithine transaminase [unclassified Ectothiorhodospira]MCG5514617.1 acetylornithine transaminase [Ectothiorhodospira sp. 9100]MCG5518009.1 acetylornithine transaminase [Ectothiorhodospira sp. 9905]